MSGSYRKNLKYHSAEIAIRKLIADKHLHVGDKIPSVRELAKLMPYSEITVRQALDNMFASGIIERRSGIGTFLAHQLDFFSGSSFILFLYCRHPFKQASVRYPATLNAFLARHGIGLRYMDVTEFTAEIMAMAELASGIIVSGAPDKAFLEETALLRLPTVTVGYMPENCGIPNISSDSEELGYLLTRHFIERGKKHIMFYDHGAYFFSDRRHRQGYLRALKEAGLPELILKKEYEKHWHLLDHLDGFFSCRPETEAMLLSPFELFQYHSWALKQPGHTLRSIGLLGSLPPDVPYRANPDFVFQHGMDIEVMAGKALLDFLADGTPLMSQCIKPAIGGISDDWVPITTVK